MKRKTIKLDENQYKELQAVQKSDGVPVSEQVRRAVREWLKRRNEERPNLQ